MTAIILTIIGILLAALAGLMVLWYGGDAFEKGAMTAEANTLVNNMQQFENAVRLYEGETGIRIKDGFDLETLIPRYVKRVPKHRFWESDVPLVASDQGRYMLYSVMYDTGRQSCASINKRYQKSSVIPVITNWRTQTNGKFGCYDTGTPLHILVLWSRT